MKYLDEYRDANVVREYIRAIEKIAKREWTLMEICGGQTHNLVRFGIDQMLPKNISLVHGPGCPVCVTPIDIIDKAITIALLPEVIFTSFGDMLRVPGSEKDLLFAKAEGADIRIVYSPLDAVEIAKRNPKKKVVFFAIGFETTAPSNAMALKAAMEEKVKNFSCLVSHFRVPPAVETIASSPKSKVHGFLAAGHVCTVMGYREYEPICRKYQVPIVPTGFESLDLVQGIYMVVKQLEEGRCEVENQYARSVKREGNIFAQKLISETFNIVNQKWRGIGVIPDSGFKIKNELACFDAEKIFTIKAAKTKAPKYCIAGEILQGRKKPPQCPAFGKLCNPENPLGALMVSQEGACSAYYHYGKGAIL